MNQQRVNNSNLSGERTILTGKEGLKPTGFLFSFIFLELDRMIPNFIWKNKHVRPARETLRKNKTNEGELALPDVKTYYESAIIFKFSTRKEVDTQSSPEYRNLWEFSPWKKGGISYQREETY